MCASGVVILGYCTPQCLNKISYHIWQIKTSDLKQRHWTKTDAGLRTHPEVIHPLADPAVLLWDVLLKVLIEAGIHREELGKRRPVVLFSWRTQTFPAGLTLWLVCRFLWLVCTTSVYTNLPPVFVARPAALFCSSCSFRSSSAALRSSSSCCLIRSAWPAAALAWWRMEEVRSLHRVQYCHYVTTTPCYIFPSKSHVIHELLHRQQHILPRTLELWQQLLRTKCFHRWPISDEIL